MFSKKKAIIEVERVSSDTETGLNQEQIDLRIKAGLVNKTKMIAGKTYWEIIRTDVLSFFNIMLFVIAGFIIFANCMDESGKAKWYSGLFFTVVLICNIIIGLYQDLKAKHLMRKLKVITTSRCKVVRNGKTVEIDPSDIVIDDVIILTAGEQIPSDSILLEGNIFVNESMLTGESLNVSKSVYDVLYSGSYVTSGTCYARVDKVGKSNYIESLTEKAKAFKRNPSHILKSLKVLFRYLGIIIITFAIIIFSVYAGLGLMNSVESFAKMIRPIAGQFVGMIPAGLFLLTSLALASGVLSLYKKKANVQDFYSIEMLARSDVICVDKTGTITDGNLNVQKFINLSKCSDAEIAQIIHSIEVGTGDTNATAKALIKYFGNSEVFECEKVLPFMSDNKYSGISTKLGITYLLGAIEFLNIKNKEALIKQSEEYTSKGYRLLVLAKGSTPIRNEDKYNDEVEALAFIILQDHIKEDALATFKWFQENNVQVKVISGDNALTVSEIARCAGINGAEKNISLEGMSIEEVKSIANDYVVFGRVTPEQKEALVIALREAKHTVAMVGDGVNDMLALKRADCSIAMNSGSLGARNVSHVVLLDNNFSTMPSVVGEGRRVINNLQRTGSLFLTKTIFVATLSFVFLIASLIDKEIVYPFSTNNMILWEVFGIGLVSFFIALEPDSKPIKGGFLRNIMKNSIPYAALLLFAVLASYLCLILNKNGIYTGVREYGVSITDTAAGRYGATSIAVLTYSILSMFVLYLTCQPLNLYRGIVVGVFSALQIAVIISFAFLGGETNVLNINFNLLTGENWVAIVVIVAILGLLAVTINSIYSNLQKIKKKEKENEN